MKNINFKKIGLNFLFIATIFTFGVMTERNKWKEKDLVSEQEYDHLVDRYFSLEEELEITKSMLPQ